MPYHHLTENERYVISHLKVAGFSLREIGRRLGRHHATISREIIRNGSEYPEACCGSTWEAIALTDFLMPLKTLAIFQITASDLKREGSHDERTRSVIRTKKINLRIFPL